MRRSGSIADRASGDEVFMILKGNLRVDWRDYVALVAYYLDRDPFAVLVAIILSQNTSDKNSIKAYMKLREEVGVTPEAILGVSEESLINVVRIAGLPRHKVAAMRALAELVKGRGGTGWLLREDPWRLREELLKIKGVGKKTVDVFLSIYGRAPVFAVDTHAARIAKRWRIVEESAGYDEVSRALLEFFGSERAEEAHRLLIALGREYCRARNPRCEVCPIRRLCPSAQLG